jgi:hypothetical protein
MLNPVNYIKIMDYILFLFLFEKQLNEKTPILYKECIQKYKSVSAYSMKESKYNITILG